MRYKDLSKAKANEIKQLQSQLSYYKRQAMKRAAEMPCEDKIFPVDLPNIISV